MVAPLGLLRAGAELSLGPCLLAPWRPCKLVNPVIWPYIAYIIYYFT